MKDIKGYEGLYAITSCGRVWSYRRKRFLTPFNNGNGYLKVNLHKDGKRKSFYLHRLVAEAYLPNPSNLPEVDHVDGNKEHNYINNLQWISKPDNIKKAQNVKIKCVETGIVYPSVTEAASAVDRDKSAISNCLAGRIKTCGGYHWQYVD